MSVLLYLDRFATTPTSETLLTELKLSKGQLGEAVGAFFLAYALMQIPSGWLTDTLGARWMLALYVALWSLATIGLGLAQGLAAIWLMRLVIGITQAGAYPAAASLLKRWIPYSARGLANSSVSMGGRSGLLLSVILTVPLMFAIGWLTGWQTDQWRVVFVLYGALGLVWVAAFVWQYRDWPAQHPACNAAEVDLIAQGSTAAVREPIHSVGVVGLLCGAYFIVNIGWIVVVGNVPKWVLAIAGGALAELTGNAARADMLVNASTQVVGICGTLMLAVITNQLLRRWTPAVSRRVELPLAEMLVSKEAWLMCAINPLVNIGWIFLATWLPQYLIDKHGTYLRAHIGNEILIAALITGVVGVAAICGGLLGGRATDLLVARFGRTWGRRLPGMVAYTLVCGMYLVVPRTTGLWPFVVAMIFIAFTIDFGLGALWATYQDIGGRHVASILGCGNMCGNLGAAFFGRQIGYLADQDEWNMVFYIAAGAMALAAGCWLLFNASRPVVRE